MTYYLLCTECEISYYVRPCEVATSKFCSRRCQREHQKKSLPQRYWAKVDKRGPDECWPWLACRDENGYGHIRPNTEISNEEAHRVGYELQNGPIPEGLLVCHTCDNPPCQNPAHWFLGTQADNTADKMAKGRHRNGSSKTL